MADVFDIGDEFRISIQFRDANGALSDPSTVKLTLRSVTGIIAVWDYADGSLTKPSVGNYYRDYTGQLSGDYWGRWESVGNPTLAEEFHFRIRESKVL